MDVIKIQSDVSKKESMPNDGGPSRVTSPNVGSVINSDKTAADCSQKKKNVEGEKNSSIDSPANRSKAKHYEQRPYKSHVKKSSTGGIAKEEPAEKQGTPGGLVANEREILIEKAISDNSKNSS